MHVKDDNILLQYEDIQGSLMDVYIEENYISFTIYDSHEECGCSVNNQNIDFKKISEFFKSLGFKEII